MYGLPQAGMLANNRLTKNLATYRYSPTSHTTFLSRNQICPISFTLVVDKFLVKYVGRQHAEHQVSNLADLYPLTTDWEGKLYFGLTLN